MLIGSYWAGTILRYQFLGETAMSLLLSNFLPFQNVPASCERSLRRVQNGVGNLAF